MDNRLRSQVYCSAAVDEGGIQKPQFASEPLSPDRACTIVPSGTRFVGPNGPVFVGVDERESWTWVSGCEGCLGVKVCVVVGGGIVIDLLVLKKSQCTTC
jgi:hypothetical protein